jgi:hypothetical protein
MMGDDIVERLAPRWATDEEISRAAARHGPAMRKIVTDFLVANNALKAEARTEIETLRARVEEVQGWAAEWHRHCQTVATLLELREPEGATFAAEAASAIASLRARVGELERALDLASNKFGFIAGTEGVPTNPRLFALGAKRFCEEARGRALTTRGAAE